MTSTGKIILGFGLLAGLTGAGFLIYRNRKSISQKATEAGQKLNQVTSNTMKKMEETGKKVVETIQKWIKPVAASRISSPFGNRTNPVTKKTQFHNGIDLPVPVGTAIKAPMDGVVENVYSNAEGGNQLIIKHTNGYKTGYAHLKETKVKKGDKVIQGQIVALSGNTGQSTGAHLHLTLRDQKGTLIDPAKVLYV